MKTAVVFAGQGAQTVGMGRDLAEAFPACRELFERANDALGYDLAGLCFEGPEEELKKSSHCQPAIFVVSAACHAALRDQASEPAVAGAAGLSLGEWSALHAAGCLSFEETLDVLAARGRYMQDACDERAIGFRLGTGGQAIPKLEADICTGCGSCVASCPVGAIEFETKVRARNLETAT